MALPTASDNVFPKVILSEGAAPATPSSGQVKLYAKSDGLLYSKDDAGTETLVSGGSGGGAGSGTGSYYGYNAAGGSTENMTQYRAYTKKITVSSAGLLVSIGAYIQERDAGDHLGDLSVALLDDNAGTPGKVLAASNLQAITLLLAGSAGVQGSARWVHRPVVYPVSAADYWISVMEPSASSGHRIYYDGSGSDRYYTSAGAWWADWGFYSPTTSSNKYSIRAIVVPMTIT